MDATEEMVDGILKTSTKLDIPTFVQDFVRAEEENFNLHRYQMSQLEELKNLEDTLEQ